MHHTFSSAPPPSSKSDGKAMLSIEAAVSATGRLQVTKAQPLHTPAAADEHVHCHPVQPCMLVLHICQWATGIVQCFTPVFVIIPSIPDWGLQVGRHPGAGHPHVPGPHLAAAWRAPPGHPAQGCRYERNTLTHVACVIMLCITLACNRGMCRGNIVSSCHCHTYP
jgi:hypothetical protein